MRTRSKIYIRILLWLLSTVLVLLLVLPVFLPDSYNLARSIVLDSDRHLVFEVVADFSKRIKWDPRIEREPGAQVKLHGKMGDVGSGWSWKGETIGSGQLTIIEIEPPEYIMLELNIYEPYRKTGTIHWKFMDTSGGTYAEWSVSGQLRYPVERLMGLIHPRSVGKELEKGLGNLEAYCDRVESIPREIRTGRVQIKNMEPRMVLCIRTETNMDEVISVLDTSYKKILEYIRRNRSAMIGSPMAVYTNFSEITNNVTIEAVLTVADSLPSSGDITFRHLPAIPVVYAIHYGPYHTVSSTYDSMLVFVGQKNLGLKGDAWEEYINDPAKVDSDYQLETIVYFPLR